MENELIEVKEVGSKRGDRREGAGGLPLGIELLPRCGYHPAAQFKQSEGSDIAPQP